MLKVERGTKTYIYTITWGSGGMDDLKYHN